MSPEDRQKFDSEMSDQGRIAYEGNHDLGSNQIYKVTIRLTLDGGLKITSKHHLKAYNDVINLSAE